MRTSSIIVLCIVIVIGGGIAWCKLAYPTYSYRYRMTVEVFVDGAVRSGSSVIEVQIHTQPNLLANPKVVPEVLGEAVFVDLGDGRNVIALLASGTNGANVDYPSRLIPSLFDLTYDDRGLGELAQLRGSQNLLEKNMPTLVTFADLTDPKSARIVQPLEFRKTFGPGVQFKRVGVELTDDAVTSGIEGKIPWIGNYAIEMEFERTLRASEHGQGPSMTPGMNLKRGR